MNIQLLDGHLGSNPESYPTRNGGVVAKVSLATDDSYYDKTRGERVERTTWHRLTFFGKTAEVILEHGRKGSRLFVSGKTRNEQYLDKEGASRESTTVVVDKFNFIGPRPKNKDDEGYDRNETYQPNEAGPEAEGDRMPF